MVSYVSVIPTFEYFETLFEKYGFQPKDGIVIPLDGVLFSQPPGKISVYVKTFDANYCLL